jgi:hypothetical protein
MTLGNMRRLGVQRLIASYLNDACRHTALIEHVSYSSRMFQPIESQPIEANRTPWDAREAQVDFSPC